MSAVSILTYAAQARTGSSAAFDANAFSTLRLDLKLTADHGMQPYIRIFIEAAPAESGPWTVLEDRRYSRVMPGKERIVIAGFDRYVRIRWAGGCENESITKSYGAPYGPGGGTLVAETGALNPGFIIGLTGDGQPNAA